MGSEQEEDEMLILPKAQLGNMLTSATPDLTVTEVHSRTPISVYSIFLEYARMWNRYTDDSLRAINRREKCVLLCSFLWHESRVEYSNDCVF